MSNPRRASTSSSSCVASRVERHPACGCCLIRDRLGADGVNMIRGSRCRLGLSFSILRPSAHVASSRKTTSWRPAGIDASVAAKWLIDEEGSEAALRLHVLEYDLVCPDLLFLEIGNVVWRKVRAREIEESDGRAMVAAILEAPVDVEAGATLLPAAWEIAVRYDRSLYDGVYLALSLALDAPLVTADRRLARALRGTDLAERAVDTESLPENQGR